MGFGPVTDEELVLNGIIQVACLLEGLDVELQEEGEPALLYYRREFAVE